MSYRLRVANRRTGGKSLRDTFLYLPLNCSYRLDVTSQITADPTCGRER